MTISTLPVDMGKERPSNLPCFTSQPPNSVNKTLEFAAREGLPYLGRRGRERGARGVIPKGIAHGSFKLTQGAHWSAADDSAIFKKLTALFTLLPETSGIFPPYSSCTQILNWPFHPTLKEKHPAITIRFEIFIVKQIHDSL